MNLNQLSFVEWIFLMLLFTVSDSEDPDVCMDVARGKSTGYNTVAGLHSVSGGTADGITDGLSYGEGGWSKCVHTNDARTDPFVYVDLVDVVDVAKVTIESGPTYTLPSSGDMKIVVSESSLETVSDFAAATVCATVPSTGFTAQYTVDEFLCEPEPITGRYVGYIVEGEDQAVIFCETEVFTRECIYPDQCLTLVCDDNDACTIDTCDTELGCQFTPISCASNLICVDGECERDCSSFIIDDFLLDCSAEFEGNENDIATLQGNVATINGRLDGLDADITTDNGRLDGLDVSITTINSEIVAINGALTDDAALFDGINVEISAINDAIIVINQRLDLYGAHSEGSVSNVLSNHDILMNNKDILIIFLLIFNILTIIGGCIACALWRRSKMKYFKYENVNRYSSSDENRRLQS